MSGFWPHLWLVKYHRKETPCKEKSTLHGNSLFQNFEKNRDFSLKAEKANYYEIEEIEDFVDDEYNDINNLNFDNLYWVTKKTPYGKKVKKKVYDVNRKMFFYPRNQEFSLMNRFEPLASEDVQKEDVTPKQQEDFHSSNKDSSNINNFNIYDSNNCICCKGCNYICNNSDDNQISNNIGKSNNKKIDCSGYPKSFNKTPLKTKNKTNTNLNTINTIFDSVLDYLSYSNSINPGTTDTLNTLYMNTVINNIINNDINNNSDGRNKNEYIDSNKDNNTNKFYKLFNNNNDNSKIIDGTYGKINSIHNNKIISISNSNMKHKPQSLYTETILSSEDQEADSKISNKNKKTYTTKSQHRDYAQHRVKKFRYQYVTG